MSLFNLKEVWSKRPEKQLDFIPSSFQVLAVNSSNCLICASINGNIKIFCPGRAEPNDELAEFSIGTEVHQIRCGRFVSSSSDVQLGVLCPRSIKILFINFNVSESFQVSLEPAYEHVLERYSFNMVCGPFGKGNSDRDFICVQSLDGFLTIYEQETKGLSSSVPEFLLPSSFLYMDTSDSFVLASLSQTVSSYQYQNFTSDSSAKAMKPEWTFNCGENICDLRSVNYENCQPSILALGDRNIYCFTDTGTLRFIKKLDCTPICFHSYSSLVNDSVNYMIATTNASLLVLQDQKLNWTSQLPFTPCFVTTFGYNGISNLILAASSAGRVMLGYLGTDPDLTSYVTRLDSRTTENYEMLQSQLSGVRSTISGKQLSVEQRDDSQDQIDLVAHVPDTLDSHSRVRGSSVPSVTVSISLTGKAVVNDIEVVVSPLPPITAAKSQIQVISAGGSKNETKVEFTFYVEQYATPSDLTVPVSASFRTSTGRPKVSQTSFRLPFNLCCTVCEPKKTQEHKLTLDFNRTPLPVAQLFSNVFPEHSAAENNNAIAFQFFSGAVVTILTASKSNRYRFQSDDFDAIWLALSQFEIVIACAASTESLGYSGQIPIQELLNAVELHSQIRINLANISELVVQRSTQFRVIQKRLLAKFKEKNADSLMNMDALLEGTYKQLNSLGEAAEEMEDQLKVSGCKLSSVSKILFFLCKLIKNLSTEEQQTIENAFSSELLFSNPSDQGWEEHADAAITHLLKTTMSKDPREDNSQIVTLEKYPSPEKLLRHVKLLIDRIMKGASPGGGKSRSSSSTSRSVPSYRPEKAQFNDSHAIMEEDEEDAESAQQTRSYDVIEKRASFPVSENGMNEDKEEVNGHGDNPTSDGSQSPGKAMNGLEHFDFSSEL